MKQPVFVSVNPSVSTGLTKSGSHDSGVIPEDVIHELRQPLGVIETLAYYLELTAQNDKALSHAQQIQAMVTKVNRILSTVSADSTSATPAPVVLTRSAAS
jgi:signal transduction histidine kinase